ncbi:hypothetical protein SAMN05216548_11173 [Faunimonas pinastri]|uniref:Uncharacterized protein n=1 Tax=Faunimonas pinastri TaxID=1855383 RepID=A0A1H9LER0_9HYPH|nr:hypothetical protein SAMN05216548_11173 [Faunimonas pinastri]
MAIRSSLNSVRTTCEVNLLSWTNVIPFPSRAERSTFRVSPSAEGNWSVFLGREAVATGLAERSAAEEWIFSRFALEALE